jgi:DnaJ-class molecular chaperone
METTSPSQTGQGADRNTCYLCHGKGHWARDCTSLPSVFLVENPPRCYSCGGAGHYARFCPSGNHHLFCY